MRSLLNFFLRYSNFLIFLLLEAVAFYLLYNGTSYHNIRIANTVNSVEGIFLQKITRASDYFSLRQVNQALARENLELRNQLQRIYLNDDLQFVEVNDTLRKQQYLYTAATVVNQTVNRQKNFITLNKGTIQGVNPGMAVAAQEGLVGVVVGASRNYCVVMSVLNLDFRLSARFTANGYYGSLGWDGVSRSHANLHDIPHHVSINIGDTIETSGYSAIFPAGVMIGTVADVNSHTGDFLNIKVALSTDFSSLHNVYIIGNLLKEEQIRIETESQKRSETGND